MVESVQSAARTDVLPGVPVGDYEVIQFRTRFAQKQDAIETVVMTRDGAAWKVSGYFIK